MHIDAHQETQICTQMHTKKPRHAHRSNTDRAQKIRTGHATFTDTAHRYGTHRRTDRAHTDHRSCTHLAHVGAQIARSCARARASASACACASASTCPRVCERARMCASARPRVCASAPACVRARARASASACTCASASVHARVCESARARVCERASARVCERTRTRARDRVSGQKGWAGRTYIYIYIYIMDTVVTRIRMSSGCLADA